MTAGYSRAAFSEINAAYSDNQLEAPAAPVSCAAMLARKMGASDLHTVMAAGLAGGIGLSGGACGALGAAIWIIEMNRVKKGTGKVEFNSPEATEAIDRFMQSSDCEFECSKIVGRKFESVNDHAAYLRAGGCARIIEALAEQPRSKSADTRGGHLSAWGSESKMREGMGSDIDNPAWKPLYL